MSLPDGPKLPALLQILQLLADPTEFLESCDRRYGSSFTLRVLGGSAPPVTFFSDPRSIQAIFTTLSGKFEMGKVTHVFRPLTGDQSLIMQDGIRHQQQRQLLMPALHKERLYGCGQLICDITQSVAAGWAPGEAIDLQSEMLNISLEIILQVVFGLQPGTRCQQLKQLLHRLMEQINSPIYSIQFFLPPLQQNLGAWSPWGGFLRQRQQIDDLIYAEIDERRGAAESDRREDILAMLMSARDESGEPLSNVELRDQLMTLLLLGHETTASGLAWAFYWLYRQPEMLERLLGELDSSDDPIALSQLPYLNAVCKEALRIYPIALISQPRKVKETVELEGYEFAPGAILVPCIYLAHRRSAAYPNPSEFQPDRFLTAKSPYEYFPFGGGSRSCIGMALAMFEMKLVLATILKHCQLEAVGTKLAGSVHPVRRGITFVPPPIRLSVVGRRDRSAAPESLTV